MKANEQHMLASADLWLEQLEPLLGDKQVKLAKERIDSFRVTGFPHPNWKKFVLEAISHDSFFQVWGRDFGFVNLNDATALLDEIFLDDVYGLRSFKNLNRVVDVGASNGFFAFSIAKLFPKATIECVEPSPLNIQLLEQNLNQEIKSGTIKLHAKALHKRSCNTFLLVPDDKRVWGGLGATVVSRERLAVRDTRKVKVETILLSELLKSRVDLLKCDIEGMEFDALPIAGELIKNCKKILIEVHADVNNFETRFRKLLSYLSKNGFKYSVYDGSSSCSGFLQGRPSPSFMLCAISLND